MQSSSYQFLACPTFSENEHPCFSRRDGLNKFAQIAHLDRVTNNMVELECFGRSGTQSGIILKQLIPFGAACDCMKQFLGCKWFRQVINGSSLNRLHREFWR